MYRPPLPRRKPSPRLPWKRGPVAWRIAQSADEVRLKLSSEKRHFLSLRQTSSLLGVSIQPVRVWIKRRFLKSEHRRQLIAKTEIIRFVDWLAQRAEPFDTARYVDRFYWHRRLPTYPFWKLSRCKFVWPYRQPSLTPKELSKLIGCHPSLIVKAITKGWLRGKRKSPRRWEVTRRAWEDRFPLTVQFARKPPESSYKVLLPTAEVARRLSAKCLRVRTQRYVRKLIRTGQLEAERPTPGGRKWFVNEASLAAYCRKLKKAS